MADALPYLVIVCAALGGFSIASYIYGKKRTSQPLVCPVGSTCDMVIHSDYSRFLGIPVEILGILYYGFVAVSYGAVFVLAGAAHPVLSFVLLVATVGAFLFSGYLTFIQAFTLRQWCTWCLISAGLCTLIFAFAVVGMDYAFFDLIAANRPMLSLVHLVALTVGVGGATIGTALFVRFLRDFRISELEAGVLHLVSQIMWGALGLFMVSGIGVYLPAYDVFRENPVFTLELSALAVIIITGALLTLFLTPRLVSISFGQSHDHAMGELRHARSFAYSLGAVSLVSWYTLFLVSIVPLEVLSASTLLFLYIFALGASVLIARLLDQSANEQAMI